MHGRFPSSRVQTTTARPSAHPSPQPTTTVQRGVSPHHHLYVVDFGDAVRPRVHYVDKNRVCHCALGESCPAIDAVEIYLKHGGERARAHPPGYHVTVPNQCPVCRQRCYSEPRLTSRVRGLGWRCTEGGSAHYWQDQGRAMARKTLAREIWRTARIGIQVGPPDLALQIVSRFLKDLTG